MPVDPGTGMEAGWKMPVGPTITKVTPSTPIANPSGDNNSYQSNVGDTSGAMGGLSSTVFDASKEFTTLPIRFGSLLRSVAIAWPSGAYTPVTLYDQLSDGGITPDPTAGLLIFNTLPITAWVQIYGWLFFLGSAVGERYGRIMDVASGVMLPGATEGQPGMSGGNAFSWCSLPVSVATITAGVRLEAYQSVGSPLNLLGAALWAKRIQ